MQDTGIRSARQKPEPARARRGWPLTADSLLWLVLAAGLFVLAQLTPALLRMPLGADEITYIAQTSLHQSEIILPPVHGRGVALLAAPVTLLTNSVVVLRIWMAVLSGIGLFLGLLCWRGIRQAWVLGVGGFILASLSITQLSGVQIYPDWWTAVGVLGITGLFLQAVTHRMSRRATLPLIGFASFFIVLLRPQNIFFALVPMIVAALVVRGWRDRGVLIATGIGILLGLAEWAGEAFALYGGLFHRISMARQEPPSLYLYFSLGSQLRVLNGPWYCMPGTCSGIDFPAMTLWWLVFLGIIVLGIWAVRRTPAQASGYLAAATAAWVIVCYTLLVNFSAPRYFLPAFALLVINAADGIAWLVKAPRWRGAAVFAVCAFLVAGVIGQRFVLNGQIKVLDAERADYINRGVNLGREGVHPPCAIESPSIAYFAGCGAPWTGLSLQQYLQDLPGGLKGWYVLYLPEKGGPNLSVVYVKQYHLFPGAPPPPFGVAPAQ